MTNAPDDWLVENGTIVLPAGDTGEPARTIPLTAVTATRIQRHIKWPMDARICIAIGVINNVLALIVSGFGAATFVVGFALIAIGLFMALRAKPVYRLLVSSGGTEIIAAQGSDKAAIEAAGAALDRLRTQPE